MLATDNPHALKIPIGKCAYFIPSNLSLVKLIIQHCNTNKVRFCIFRVAEIPCCE